MSTIKVDPAILCLREAIGHAMVRYAPEHDNEILQFIKDRKVVFLLDDENGAHCQTSPPVVYLGVPFLERLWARSYAYYVLYVEMQAEKTENPSIPDFDVQANTRRQQAGDLLRWAIEGDLSGRKLRWMSGLPEPAPSTGGTTDGDCANDIFLCACAFVQHHELAHLRLQHHVASGAESVDQERDADYEAADLVLGAIQPEDPMFIARSLGVSVALLTLASGQIYSGKSATTHPQPFNRLLNVLQRCVPEPDHFAWALVGFMLNLHLQHSGIEIPPCTEKQTHSEIVDHLVEVISNHVANSDAGN